MNEDERTLLTLAVKVSVLIVVLSVAAFFAMPYASYVESFLQSNGGVVHGQVIGLNGPVNDVTVEIFNPASYTTYATISSDTAAGGWYSLNLPTGNGYVIYALISCSPKQFGIACFQHPVTFNIENGTSLTINIYLLNED